MQPQTEHEAALVETAASVIAKLMLAVELADREAITVEIARLLNAITKHNRAMRERPSDAPLRRAISMLSANDP
jgi:hypothetical protein